MGIFLDSANLDDVRHAMALGFVAGITTNPSIIAREQRRADTLIPELLELCTGLVFHQVRFGTVAEMLEEAEAYARLSERVALKIPCTLEGVTVLAKATEFAPCAVTAIFSPAQALMACAAGADYLIPYVNRTTRLLGDGPALVRQMADVCHASGAETTVMAASLKSSDEVVAALLAGAEHITAPWSVLEALAEHPLSRQAIAEFEAAASGQ